MAATKSYFSVKMKNEFSSSNATFLECIQNLTVLFMIFDKDEDGRINAAELGHIMRSMGHNPTRTDLHQMINQAEADNDSGTKGVVRPCFCCWVRTQNNEAPRATPCQSL